MITLNKTELENFVPISNWILIKPNRGEEEYILSGGMKIQIDISYNREQHAPVTGTVIAVPKTIFPASPGVVGMQWDVDMELQRGDVIAYSYLAAMGALEPHEGRIIMCEGQPYFMVPYEEVFVAKRFYLSEEAQFEVQNGKMKFSEFSDIYQSDFKNPLIIPVNGYCLIEPVEESVELKIGSLIMDQVDASKNASSRYGRVVYPSKGLIRKYIDGDGHPDTDQIKTGDYIAFDRASDLLCEYDLHASLDGKKKFYRIQRRYIQAIVPESLIKTK